MWRSRKDGRYSFSHRFQNEFRTNASIFCLFLSVEVSTGLKDGSEMSFLSISSKGVGVISRP